MKIMRIVAVVALVCNIAHAGIQDRIEYKQGRILAGMYAPNMNMNNKVNAGKNRPMKAKKGKRKTNRRAMMRN